MAAGRVVGAHRQQGTRLANDAPSPSSSSSAAATVPRASGTRGTALRSPVLVRAEASARTLSPNLDVFMRPARGFSADGVEAFSPYQKRAVRAASPQPLAGGASPRAALSRHPCVMHSLPPERIKRRELHPTSHSPETRTHSTSYSAPPALTPQLAHTTYALPPSPNKLEDSKLSSGEPLTPSIASQPHGSGLGNVLQTTYGTPLQTTYGAPMTRTVMSECSSEPDMKLQAGETTYGAPPQLPVVLGSGRQETTYGQPADLVEYQAVFVRRPQCWSFEMPPAASVNQAMADAVVQARQRNGPQNDSRLDEQLSVTVLPSASRECLVGEWTQQNLGQPPLIIIGRGQDAANSANGRASDVHDLQRIVEDQMMMLAAVQKQLIEQSAIIQNQESFIAEIQSSSRKEWHHLQESMRVFEGDIAGMKERMRELQDRAGDRAGKASCDKKDNRRRRSDAAKTLADSRSGATT